MSQILVELVQVTMVYVSLVKKDCFNVCFLILEMAGAMMIERAQSIPAMESIDPKEYLAK